MHALFYWVYSYIALPLFWLALQIASVRNDKIRNAINGRRLLFERLIIATSRNPHQRRILIHSSSMGEFEQTKPIFNALRSRYPHVGIILSFFSPSGFNNARKFRDETVLTYLPFDTRRNVRRFLDICSPSLAVITRYDLWPNFLHELRKRKISVVITNASVKYKPPFKYFVSSRLYKFLFSYADLILTVSEDARNRFIEMGIPPEKLVVAGDTRYDQVHLRALEARTKDLISEEVTKNKFTVVAGSTWREEEEVLFPAFLQLLNKAPDALLILVPHEPKSYVLEFIESELTETRTIRFSNLRNYKGESVIVVDSVGILMTLYKYGAAAFVGGSFRRGIHNVLEPAVYGIPVFYGPKHRNSAEATEMASLGLTTVVHGVEECYLILDRLYTDWRTSRSASANAKAAEYINSHLGATSRIMNAIEPLIPSHYKA